MGALPKRKISKGRRNRRRSHHNLRLPNLVPCPNCNELRLPHKVCPFCGHYGGANVIEVKAGKK
jgi:large subunit ribosomal protein L32